MIDTQAEIDELSERVVDALWVENHQHMVDCVGAVIFRGIFAALLREGWILARSPLTDRATMVATDEKKAAINRYIRERIEREKVGG